jgi:CrcB protein
MESAHKCVHADDSYSFHRREGAGVNKLIVLVGIGGFLGSASRYALSGYVQQLTQSTSFSYGTIAVNVLGCLAVGFLSQLAESRGFLSPEARAILIIGFLGGFTTFSTFGNETVNLVRDSQNRLALFNVAAHVALGLGAVWAGRALAFSLWR